MRYPRRLKETPTAWVELGEVVLAVRFIFGLPHVMFFVAVKDWAEVISAGACCFTSTCAGAVGNDREAFTCACVQGT